MNTSDIGITLHVVMPSYVTCNINTVW